MNALALLLSSVLPTPPLALSSSGSAGHAPALEAGEGTSAAPAAGMRLEPLSYDLARLTWSTGAGESRVWFRGSDDFVYQYRKQDVIAHALASIGAEPLLSRGMQLEAEFGVFASEVRTARCYPLCPAFEPDRNVNAGFVAARIGYHGRRFGGAIGPIAADWSNVASVSTGASLSLWAGWRELHGWANACVGPMTGYSLPGAIGLGHKGPRVRLAGGRGAQGWIVQSDVAVKRRWWLGGDVRWHDGENWAVLSRVSLPLYEVTR